MVVKRKIAIYFKYNKIAKILNKNIIRDRITLLVQTFPIKTTSEVGLGNFLDEGQKRKNWSFSRSSLHVGIVLIAMAID